MGDLIQGWDAAIFRLINHTLSNGAFDVLMPLITNLNRGWGGVIFALGLIGFLGFKLKKRAPWAVLALVVGAGATDMFCHRVVKANVQRERPTTALENVNLRVHKHSGFSFPSNHAANSFAGATLISLSIPPAAPYFLAYAAIVAYSRVYVGVHYPFDALAGSLIGALFGTFAFLIFRRKIHDPSKAKV